MSLPLESLAVESMHSGHKSLNLTGQVSWADFPAYAMKLGRVLGSSEVPHAVADSAVTRLWELWISEVALLLVWDDYPSMVSLESRDDRGDAVIVTAYAMLRSHAAARNM